VNGLLVQAPGFWKLWTPVLELIFPRSASLLQVADVLLPGFEHDIDELQL
jgi:hypothetical protein